MLIILIIVFVKFILKDTAFVDILVIIYSNIMVGMVKDNFVKKSRLCGVKVNSKPKSDD